MTRPPYRDKNGPGSSPSPATPVMRVFMGLAEAWELSEDEQLALLGLSTADEFQRLKLIKSKAELPAGIINRLSVLVRIFEAINTLLPEPDRADQWMRKPNKATLFGGQSALELMLEGLGGMRMVLRYLQAEVWCT